MNFSQHKLDIQKSLDNYARIAADTALSYTIASSDQERNNKAMREHRQLSEQEQRKAKQERLDLIFAKDLDKSEQERYAQTCSDHALAQAYAEEF